MSGSRRPGPKDLVLDPETSARLGRVRQANTEPELLVRQLLHRLGFRFRVGARDLPGSPDIVNRRKRWAVFVHGCFWHAHRGCNRATVPTRNRAFWTDKFSANRRRDARKIRELQDMGYNIAVIWECEVYAHPDRTVQHVARQLRRGARGQED